MIQQGAFETVVLFSRPKRLLYIGLCDGNRLSKKLCTHLGKDSWTKQVWRKKQEKNLPATEKTWVQFLGWEDPLEKGMATHSSILAWRIPWMGCLWAYSPWDCKRVDMT